VVLISVRVTRFSWYILSNF